MEYVSLDESGYESRKGMSDKAREGKTDLQKSALAAVKAPKGQFRDREQHKAFMAWEDKASPIDRTENGKMMLAWMQVCIRNASSLNRKITNVSMDKLLRNFANEAERLRWWNDLDQKEVDQILDKRPINNIPGLAPAKSLKRPTYVKKATDYVMDVIAAFEAELNINMRISVSNTSNAELIANDMMEHPERTVEKFFQWARNDSWWGEENHWMAFKSVAKAWEMWPKAFETKVESW